MGWIDRTNSWIPIHNFQAGLASMYDLFSSIQWNSFLRYITLKLPERCGSFGWLNGTTFEVRIPNFWMPNFRPSLYRLLKVQMSICSTDQIFELSLCRTLNIVKNFEQSNFRTCYKFLNKLFASTMPDPTQLGCSFLVTNIPLGAYLLGLGDPFWAQLG
jgi:hypothetical protein